MEELSRLQGDAPFGWTLALGRLLARLARTRRRTAKPVYGPEPRPWSLLRW